MVEQVIVLDGPAILFGGCYSNLQATQALFDVSDGMGIPARRVICTGDVVAYGADAAATVALVQARGIPVVMGNCEEQLAAGEADCGCGFDAGSACALLSVAWFRHAAATLGPAARAWMGGLPRRIDLVVGARRLAVMHGDAEQINAFRFGSAADATLSAQLDRLDADGFVGGHCGVPFSRVVDGRLWHNPGAIGMPANDGTPRTWFSVVWPDGASLRIERRPLAYDHAGAAAAMRSAGLPEGYAGALSSGLWPSCDVLPATERAATGRALTAESLVW